MASWLKIPGDGGLFIIEKGVPRRLNGKAVLLPGVRSKGAEVKGIFMGADLGITSGLSGSRPLCGEAGDVGDLRSRSFKIDD